MKFETKYKLSYINLARHDLIKNGMKWDDKAKEFWSDCISFLIDDIKWQWNGYDGMGIGDIHRIEDHNEIVDYCGFDRSEYKSEDFNDYLQDYLIKRNSPKKGWQHIRYSDYLEYGQ